MPFRPSDPEKIYIPITLFQVLLTGEILPLIAFSFRFVSGTLPPH
jgi:hypothetical protein